MRIGLLLGGPASAHALGMLAAECEALGFDSLWAGDHVAFPAPVLDPLELLACFAAHTRRVRLGTCVYLLPLRHPTVVAKMVASLDSLSEGRLVFGVGVGGEFPAEFAACEVPIGERGRRADEALAVLRALWREPPAEHAGRFFRIPPVRLAPAPVQPGGPPIWIGGRSDAALRRAARAGDGWVGYLMSPEGVRARMERLRTLLPEGRSLTVALLAFVRVEADRTQALARTAAVLGAMYGRPMERAAAGACITGAPEECRSLIARYATAGVEHLILSPLAHGDATIDQVRALAGALER